MKMEMDRREEKVNIEVKLNFRGVDMLIITW